MTDQPEALRLAELIDNDLKNSAHHVEAAAELRRLHAECDALRAEPEPEPVAWQWLDTATFRRKVPARSNAAYWRPLYTSPPTRRPLTDEEIDELPWCPSVEHPMTLAEGLRHFARAIERAHNITGGNDE